MVRVNSRSRQGYHIVPNSRLSVINLLGFVPEMVRRYALTEEQVLLATLRHNRLIDVFTESVCYSLGSPLRTFMPGIGEVETSEIYLGLNMAGKQFVIPAQARGPRDCIGTLQVERDLAVCASKFPALICRPIGAQLIEDGEIALFEFTMSGAEVSIKTERHYHLVRDEDLTDEEIAGCRS